MRCAICGGEIDSKTRKCLKCGECWGGGNRGVAQDISRIDDSPKNEPAPSSFFDPYIDRVKTALSTADTAVTGCVGKLATLFNRKTTERQNRLLAYGTIIAILAVLIIVPLVCCNACTVDGLCGRWSAADSNGSLTVEFTDSGEINMYVLSGDEEKLYRSGTYSLDGEFLNIHYDDGEFITMTCSVNRDAAVFTLLATGQEQVYIRK